SRPCCRPCRRPGLLAPAAVPTPPGVVRLAAPPDTAAYAHALYAALRAADEQGLDRVVAVPPEGGALADAVLDRLRRAAVGSSRHRPFG
ncbi:Sua5 family C-terminal domain-containing protein, partial [Kineosporia sp. A_224]|uniref:Sua5 family C-terminal domain-containing protein n=1 Tax=Kineosporia sp. A_224 TaxID=1962180 RepID=UPI001E3D68AE